MGKNCKVVAVVVTFNRLELLKRTVVSLQATDELHTIIVVNNGSTDGTADWLASAAQTTNKPICIVTQANEGGSGGFHRGISEAMTLSPDWVWCMDDDVFPRPDCLRRLLDVANGFSGNLPLGLLAPRRLMDENIYTNDFTRYNLTNPFASFHGGKLRKRAAQIVSPCPIAGTAFEGPLISAQAIRQVGLPNKDLFIFCDDTDYCLRLYQAGFALVSVPTALMDKHRFFSNDSWAERNSKKKWKRFYQVRNAAYLNHHYGKNFAVRYLRPFNGVLGCMLTALFTLPFSNAYQWRDVPRLWRAYLDGIHERLGKISFSE